MDKKVMDYINAEFNADGLYELSYDENNNTVTLYQEMGEDDGNYVLATLDYAVMSKIVKELNEE